MAGGYTKEAIEEARKIDLLTYLRQCEPENLVKINGNVYCTRDHDSLKISNGKWMWWSKGFGGNSALDYLIKVNGMSFIEAMESLTNGRMSSSSFFMPPNKVKQLLRKIRSCFYQKETRARNILASIFRIAEFLEIL